VCLNANPSYNKRETHDCVQQRERMLQSALTMMTMTTTTMMTASPLPTNTLPNNKNNNHSCALRDVEPPTPRQLHHRRNHEGPQELPAHRASRRNQRHGQPEALAQRSARLRHLHSPLQTSDQGLAALHLPLNPRGARGLEPLQANKRRRLPHQASTQLHKQREMALFVCAHIGQSTGTEHNHNQNSARVH